MDGCRCRLPTNTIRILAGNSHVAFARSVAAHIGLELSPCAVIKFANRETSVTIGESVRDEDVYIIQSFCETVNDSVVELAIIIDACRRSSARRVTAVLPCFPYARADKKDRPRAPIAARLVASMLTAAGADRIVTMDLHAAQIQGFFDVPVDHLYSEPWVLRYIRESVPGYQEAVVVAPDAGGAKRATSIADRLNLPFALITRAAGRSSGAAALVGDVRGRSCIVVDDMADSCATLDRAASLLVAAGASAVYAVATHAILSHGSADVLAHSKIVKLAVTNTIPHEDKKLVNTKLDTIDVSATFAEAIRRAHFGESVSWLQDNIPENAW